MSLDLDRSDEERRQRSFRPSRIFIEWLLVGLIASGAAIVVARAPLNSAFDRTIYDHLVRLRARAPSDRILVVAIDDASLAEFGPWPWPRRLHAAVLDRLSKAGASAVAYDVLFLEPDPTGGDPALAAALARSKRTVLPVLQLAPGDNGRPIRSVSPLASLARAARLGQVNIAPDNDGVVRRVSARAAVDGQCWEQLSFAALHLASARVGAGECATLAAVSTKVPGLLADRPQLIAFAGAPGRFKAVSAGALIRGEVPPELLRDRFVLVGATAAGLGDQHTTATSGDKGAMAGVEVQANLLDAALTGARLGAAAWWVVGVLSVMTIWILMLGLMRLRPRVGIALLGSLFGLSLLASGLAFLTGWWASPAPALAGLMLAYPLWSWRRLATTSAALGREIDRFRVEEAPTLIASGSDPLSSQINTLEVVAQELRQLHRMVADTLRSLPDPTVVVDAHGVIRLINALAEGAARDATLIGETLDTWLTLALGRLAATDINGAFQTGMLTLEVASETGASIEVSRAPLRGFGASAGWTIVRLADVSAIRQAIRQREDALQLLTHDIRAPFASISAMASSEPTSELLQRIDRYAARGRALADSYVQFSRAENAAWPSTIFDLRDCVIDAADEIWAVAALRGIVIAIEGPQVEILVSGDRSLVTRAIMNLIDNAVRFSPDHSPVDAICDLSEATATVRICDRGPGIEPALSDKLFDRFVRGTDDKGGAGLGLAMAALVARRMGGALTYTPRDAGGSVFELSVPTVAD